MKTKNTIKHVSVLLATSLGLLFSPAILAQAVKQGTPTTGASVTPPQSQVAVNNTTNNNTAFPPTSDEVVQLSPFQVDATKDKGYFAENTLAGSRMRVNVSDLGAAISVVTLQQLQDTASLDVNDVFRYEIGTEGATTYTPQTLTFRSDGLADSIAGNTFGNDLNKTVTNATANRVRGLGVPDFALDYYRAIAAIPFDTYNATSIEINRGPNAILFGMGSPAGIVNMSQARAQLNKQFGQVQVRVDHRGSNRESLNFNVPLWKGKLAIYGALLHDDKQYERKPSYDKTNREYATLTYKPFKNTTIRASIEGYSNNNRRPNSLMPRDGVSEWRAAGRPYYNPLTQQIISEDTGKVLGVYAPSSQSPNVSQLLDFLATKGYTPGNGIAGGPTNYTINGLSIFGTTLMTSPLNLSGAAANQPNPLYVPGIAFNAGRPIQQISDGALQAWIQGSVRQATGFNAAGAKQYAFSTTSGAADNIYANAANAAIYDRSWTESALWTMPNNVTGIFNKNYPAVTDTSIYNYKDVNILSMNYGSQRNTNVNIELEQIIIPDLLTFSAGWFQQNYHSMQSYTVAQLNATTLQVDTNKYYPDGTLNPFFGDVYVVDQDPDRYRIGQRDNQYRAMLAYTPDFTKNNNWTRWLGRHQVLGYASYEDNMLTTQRQRLAFYTGSQQAMWQYMDDPTQATFTYQGSTASRRYFYLSDSSDTVTKATGAGDYNADQVNGSIRLYDYKTNQWKNEALSMIWPDFNAGTGRSHRLVNSYVLAWNAWLWEDRIAATFGLRRDISKVRPTAALPTINASNASTYIQNGFFSQDAFFNTWGPWANRQASTSHTAGAVVRPFLHWDYISRRSSHSLLWETIENLGISYNQGTNFNPASVSYVDYFGTPLGKPGGRSTDYGVQTSILKGKLFARLTWFDSTNENVPASPTAMQRLYWHIDETAYRSWLGFIYMLNSGGVDLTSADWKTAAQTYAPNAANKIQAHVDGLQSWIAEKWGLGDWNYYGNLGGTIGGTSKVQAKGTEFTLQYNPSPRWTLKLTASKTTTTNTDVLKEYDAWKNIRKAVWDAATAANLLTPAVIAKYPGINTPAGYTSPGDNTQISLVDFWNSFGYYDTTANNEAGGMTITANNADPGYRNSLAFYNAVLLPQEYAAKAAEGTQVPGQRQYNAALVTTYTFDHGTLKGWAIGGGQRYSSKSIIGYYGKATGANKLNGVALLDMPDISRPIYDKEQWYTDLWISYSRKIFSNKIGMKIQLNIADIFQSGGLQPVAVNYDGSVYGYRIMDPRTFILTATFDF